jgi:hypothetical protein
MKAVQRFLHRIYVIVMMPGYVMGTAEFPVTASRR